MCGTKNGTPSKFSLLLKVGPDTSSQRSLFRSVGWSLFCSLGELAGKGSSWNWVHLMKPPAVLKFICTKVEGCLKIKSQMKAKSKQRVTCQQKVCRELEILLGRETPAVTVKFSSIYAKHEYSQTEVVLEERYPEAQPFKKLIPWSSSNGRKLIMATGESNVWEERREFWEEPLQKF